MEESFSNPYSRIQSITTEPHTHTAPDATTAERIQKTIDTLTDLHTLNPNKSDFVQPYNDPEAKFFRGTILGFVLVALLRENGYVRSPDPDRLGVSPGKTTVVSDRRKTAEAYAKLHGLNKPTTNHDIKGLAQQLGIDKDDLKEKYAYLLTPIVLHFIKTGKEIENPNITHEFHTSEPLCLSRDLTIQCRKKTRKTFWKIALKNNWKLIRDS